MANFNKVILIGNLTRDPEIRSFANGGKVAKFGFAVNNRKKNVQTGQWEDEPMFIDVDVFNRGDFGKLADVVQDYCKRGSQICIEGKLKLESWNDKTTGEKRSKHMIVAESIQLLGAKGERSGDGGNGGERAAAPARTGGGYSAPSNNYDDGGAAPPSDNGGEDVPF